LKKLGSSQTIPKRWEWGPAEPIKNQQRLLKRWRLLKHWMTKRKQMELSTASMFETTAKSGRLRRVQTE
jgi:hypothetical protein